MTTGKVTTQIPNDFKELLPTRRGCSTAGQRRDREVSLCVYQKAKKAGGVDGIKYGPRIGIAIAGKTLALLRWRAGDKVKVTQSVSAPRFLLIERTNDGSGVTLCNNDSRNPDRGLKTSVATMAFGVESAPFVPLTDAAVARLQKDSFVIEAPASIWPAIGAR